MFEEPTTKISGFPCSAVVLMALSTLDISNKKRSTNEAENATDKNDE